MKPTLLTAYSVIFLAVAPALAAEFQLTVNVIGNGTADPNAGTYQAGTVVTIIARPQPGNLLKSWSGTDNDLSTELANTVTIDSDTTVTVEFVPAIIVEKPAGGEVWSAASTHNIQWSTYGAGAVNLLFSEDGGLNWQVIGGNIPDSGSYLWQLPQTIDSNRCTILVIPAAPDPNVIIVGSGLFTIQPYSPGAEVETKWKSIAGDFDRAGLSEEHGPQLGCVKWQFDTADAVATSVTVGLAGRVHIACEDGKLYTLDADGMLLWSYDANSPLVSSPTIGADGTVYVGSRDAKLYAIDIDGSLRWTHTTGGPIHSSPAVSPDGNDIYVCSEDGTLYALGRDGSELWTFETKGPGAVPLGSIFASPAVGSDGSVYIGGLYDPNLYALDPNDGSIKWACSFAHPLNPSDPNSETVGGWPFASPILAPDGTIYQTLLYDSNLYAIDSNDGSIISSISLNVFCDFVEEYFAAHGEMPSPYLIEQNCDHWFDLGFESDDERHEMYLQYKNADGWSEPALGPDGTIYVSFDDPFLRAVDPNGTIKWVTPLGELGGFTLTVGSDALIYAAGDDGSLYVVDANGWPLAHFQSDNWLNYPVIAADNMIIVTDGKDDSLMITNPPNTVWAISQEGCRDLNFDGAIDFNDVALLAAYWLQCTDAQWPCNYQGEQKLLMADVDGDKYVKFPDLALIANLWHGFEKLLAPLPPPPPPGQASDPNPADGATGAWPSNLSWTPGSDTASYNVYFGTDNPPPFVANQAATTFEPELLLYNTTYYWRIDSVNPEGTITGPLWSFTTRDSGGR